MLHLIILAYQHSVVLKRCVIITHLRCGAFKHFWILSIFTMVDESMVKNVWAYSLEAVFELQMNPGLFPRVV